MTRLSLGTWWQLHTLIRIKRIASRLVKVEYSRSFSWSPSGNHLSWLFSIKAMRYLTSDNLNNMLKVLWTFQEYAGMSRVFPITFTKPVSRFENFTRILLKFKQTLNRKIHVSKCFVSYIISVWKVRLSVLDKLVSFSHTSLWTIRLTIEGSETLVCG